MISLDALGFISLNTRVKFLTFFSYTTLGEKQHRHQPQKLSMYNGGENLTINLQLTTIHRAFKNYILFHIHHSKCSCREK